MGRRQTGHFLELRAEMRHAAIVHLVSDFGQLKLVIDKKFLYSFYFMRNKEFLDGNTLDFRKEIGEIGIIVVQFNAPGPIDSDASENGVGFCHAAEYEVHAESVAGSHFAMI